MNDIELVALIEQQEREASSFAENELQTARERAMRYYKRDRTLPEFLHDEGRSGVITSQVQDMVEQAIPALLKPFVTTDKVAEFQPQRPEDEEGAKQASEAVQFVFNSQNQGVLVLAAAAKDALLAGNCYARVYYEEPKVKREKYKNLTMEELMLALQRTPSAQVVEQEIDVESGLISVTLEITQDQPKVCVEPVPPEQVRIYRDWHKVDLQDCPFVQIRTRKSLGDLREEGYDVPDDLSGEDDFSAESGEYEARHGEMEWEDGSPDPAMRKVWVSESFIRCDFNGDGKLELIRAVKAGRTLLEREEVDVINVAAGTLNLNPHVHHGQADAELMEDLQLISTALTRQTLDNLYLSNNPRSAVLSTPSGAPQASMDDLLNNRPGGVVREYVPNAVRPLPVPFFAEKSFGMLEFIEQMGEKRLGFTRNLAGMNPDSLNQTARGAMILQSNAMERLEMRARVFGETFVKSVFRLILYSLTQSGLSQFTYRLRDQFHVVDPRQWKQGWDMSLYVGLGSGAQKDQQLGHLMTILQDQMGLLQMGFMGKLVTPEQMYNVRARISENAGFKDPGEFYLDPESEEAQQIAAQTPPPPPPPEMMKLQAEKEKTQMQLQADAQKGQQDLMLEQQRAEQEFAIEQARLQLEAMKVQAQIELERAKAQAQMMLQGQKLQADMVMKEQQQAQQTQLAEQEQQREAEKEDADDAKEVDRFSQLAKQMEKALSGIVEQLNRPKTIVRDKSGRATGVK